MKSKRAKALDISESVKKRVWDRDGGACVICGNIYNVMPNAHFIRRSQGGLGIEQNIFTACTRLTSNDCHHRYDTDEKFRKEVTPMIVRNFKKHYKDWNEEDLIYRKY